jgi:hypothetical protein
MASGRSKRANIAFELLDTERSYVESLELCKRSYADPALDKGLLSQQEYV